MSRQLLPQLLLLLFIIHTISAYPSIQSTLLNTIKTSPLLQTLHQQHISSPHRLPPNEIHTTHPCIQPSQIRICQEFHVGRMVANVMAKEQELLGDWKIEKIVEAAGEEFDEVVSNENLRRILWNGYDDFDDPDSSSSRVLGTNVQRKSSPKVTLFSFVDCPWCLLAKQLVQHEEYQSLLDKDTTLQIIELEDLGVEGKHLRASIALATGRTSMPACFINGKSVGGYTDGFSTDNDDDDAKVGEGFTFVPRPEVDLRMMESKGLAALHETGELRVLLSSGEYE